MFDAKTTPEIVLPLALVDATILVDHDATTLSDVSPLPAFLPHLSHVDSSTGFVVMNLSEVVKSSKLLERQNL